MNKIALRFLSLFAVLGALSPAAFAGTTGTEFQSLFNLVNNWATGYLGKTLAIASFIIGALVGFAKSTAMPALVGVVFAVMFAILPGIIVGIVTAVI